MTTLTWPLRLCWFVLWFVKAVVVSNVTVLRDNLTSGQDGSPGIAAFPTRCQTDTELTLLAALITLTPGTLTLGTAPDEGPETTRTLYVHGIYHEDADALRADLAHMETRLLHALRREGDPR